MEKVRIQKLLSDAGYCSRRKAEALIAAGKVKLNGHPVKLGDQATRADLITVNGEAVRIPRRKVKRYLMLYKPRGYVTTTSDELDRRCVMDLLDGVEERVYPVGRLDKDSEGLLLLTNDGEFANNIMHPSRHISKTYRVTVRPDVTEEQLITLSSSMELDGKMTQPATKPCGAADDHSGGQKPPDSPDVRSVGAGSCPPAENQHWAFETGHAEAGYLSGLDRRRTACHSQRHRRRPLTAH